jgi:hypothetical protein
MMDHTGSETHLPDVRYAEDGAVGSHVACDAHKRSAADSLILIAADVLDDLERIRIATENRLRSLTHEPIDGERGGWFGKGFSPEQREVRQVENILAKLCELEHQATLDLRRAMRVHPLGDWVKRTIGVGEKQAARLLAVIGDPASRKTVGQLWAYCGYHVIDGTAPKRRRGQQANWSNLAKMRTFLIAESCIKQRSSPYRAIYDAGRAKYADAAHVHQCQRCGPSGKPALPGSPLSNGHQHARALRLVAKAILRDLWIEGHGTKEGPTPNDRTPRGPSSVGSNHPTLEAPHADHVAADISADRGHLFIGNQLTCAAVGNLESTKAAA